MILFMTSSLIFFKIKKNNHKGFVTHDALLLGFRSVALLCLLYQLSFFLVSHMTFSCLWKFCLGFLEKI